MIKFFAVLLVLLFAFSTQQQGVQGQEVDTTVQRPDDTSTTTNGDVDTTTTATNGDSNSNTTTTTPAVDGNTTAPAAAPQGEETIVPTSAPSCETSEDCNDGTFCSSLTSTCLTLNCTNWREGLPPGETLYSEKPCASDETDIETEFGFCGWDGHCHDYGCESWYMFGPTEYTGYNGEDDAPALVCEDYDTGKEDDMNGVVFGCRPYTPGKRAPRAKTETHFFNQKCTAQLNNGHTYECYNYKQNTNFRDYLGEVARENPPYCDPDVYGDITAQSYYWYNVIMAQERNGELTFYKDGRDNTTHTSQFDPSEATAAMYAKVTCDCDAPPQYYPEQEQDDDESAAVVPLQTNSFLVTVAAVMVMTIGMLL